MHIKYENYWNDYKRETGDEDFRSLYELETWIFGQMQTDYSKDPYLMYFPTPEILKKIGCEDAPGRIEFTPVRGKNVWIHMITDGSGGIIFSDGTFTAGQKHWSREVKDWLRHCEERRKAPVFNFVD